MNYLTIILISCSLAVAATQRLEETNTDGQRRSTGGYGLLKPGYGNPGYGGGYNRFVITRGQYGHGSPVCLLRPGYATLATAVDITAATAVVTEVVTAAAVVTEVVTAVATVAATEEDINPATAVTNPVMAKEGTPVVTLAVIRDTKEVLEADILDIPVLGTRDPGIRDTADTPVSEGTVQIIGRTILPTITVTRATTSGGRATTNTDRASTDNIPVTLATTSVATTASTTTLGWWEGRWARTRRPAPKRSSLCNLTHFVVH